MKHEREIKDYELSVNILAEIFLNKQFGEDGEPKLTIDNEWAWWFGNEVGSSLVYGDIQYRFDDILTDIKEDAPKGEIDKFNAYDERCRMLGVNPINYQSWLHGAPRKSEEELKNLESLRDEALKARRIFEDELNKANGTDF